jgi:hypothetical protein
VAGVIVFQSIALSWARLTAKAAHRFGLLLLIRAGHFGEECAKAFERRATTKNNENQSVCD